MPFAEQKNRQDAEKIKELILYISQACRNHKFYGMTKLNKILFATDFDHYFNTGSPVTGGKYKKQNQGPTLFSMVPILKEMYEDNELTFESTSVYGKRQKRPIPLREPDMSFITVEEKQLIDNWIETMKPYTASQVRDWTHRFPFWKLLQIGDFIPYSSVYWRKTTEADITPIDRQEAQRLLDRLGNKPIPRPSH